MNCSAHWLEELQVLAARFGGNGLGPDIAWLSLAEAWGLLMFLRRMAQGGVDG